MFTGIVEELGTVIAFDRRGDTARLTIDVTPMLRGRIKVVAFRRGTTAADMLRELLEREYPEDGA